MTQNSEFGGRVCSDRLYVLKSSSRATLLPVASNSSIKPPFQPSPNESILSINRIGGIGVYVGGQVLGVGLAVGLEGLVLGLAVGAEGLVVGAEGLVLGLAEGLVLGLVEGLVLGLALGLVVGLTVGPTVPHVPSA